MARAATISHVYRTTRSGFMPESKAKSSLSEKALIDFPVLVRLRNQNRMATTKTAVITVITCVVLIAKPSSRPVNFLKSLAEIMKRAPSEKR